MKDTKNTAETSYDEKEALKFHSEGRPGKIEINATKPMATQRDLALAYSPGVAAPVLAISENPDSVYDYTAKGNLVAVISNGTAVLGLGDLGPEASKPVMEGKAVLFKRFAQVDAFDIEIKTTDVDEIIRTIERWLYVVVIFTFLYCFAIEFFPNLYQYWYQKYSNSNYS